MWVGEMILDSNQEILIVADDNSKVDDAIIRLSRVGYDHAIGYLEGGFKSWLAANKEINIVNRITAEQLKKHYNKDKLVLIDVRKRSEYNSEHLVNAINIPLNEINNHLAEFPKDKVFIVYCLGGYRSMIASSILKQRGFDNFVDVIGGFNTIKATNLPLTEYVCPSTLL
jgi:rhodanese-related sulfurtransferase